MNSNHAENIVTTSISLSSLIVTEGARKTLHDRRPDRKAMNGGELKSYASRFAGVGG